MPILNLKKWRENERFTARDYMYERSAIVKALEVLEQDLQDLDVFQVILSQEEPEIEMNVGDIWLDS